MSGTMRSRRSYTAEEKQRALRLAQEKGVAAAARELRMPETSLHNWRMRGSKSQVAPVQHQAPTPPPTPAPVPPLPRPTARARVAKIYTPSQIAQALERVAAIGVRPAATELGISRNALRDWERKAAKAAKGEGPSPTSGPDPKTVEERRDAAILSEWRKQQGLGPSQIRNQLRRAGTKVSMQTVRRVMEEAGYRPPKVERRDHQGSYEALRPGQLWHMDFLHRFVHGQKVFVLALIDDYARFVTGWALDDAERADAVIGAFEGAVARHGRPEAVMSDGGSAFWAWKGSSRFTRILEEYGVDQLIATTPELNGKSEVFNANLQKELFNRVIFTDVGDLRRQLGPHFHWYNHHRTHHALGGLLVPADRFYGRVDEVLARIEAGGGAPDALDLTLRTLDLFRVVSNRGKPEIWLMGRKILDLAG
ncbi:MAG: DDE-type integrase/transposase/recombinase [Deltaproteobacteria bacterium]|nr:DDE-type integrase/transposase/recombinase [Deltaproteobacteria bacterium]